MVTTTVRSRAWGSAAAAVVLLAASACSDSDDGSGIASAGGEANAAASEDGEDIESLDEDAQALAFAECMREEGIDVPDPGPGQEGLAEAFQEAFDDHDQATIDQAFSACEDLMPQYAQEEQHDEVVMLDLAECLREQGLEISDEPFADAHGPDIDQDEFQAAMEVCRDVLEDGQ